MQPGHEYTKGNVKFCAAVSQSEPIKKLQAFVEKNQQTQGKFTIGDEKVCRMQIAWRALWANNSFSFTTCSCVSMYVPGSS